MNFFALHINDYDQATAHLTACEDGMLGRMLRRYYATERPLPSDITALARLLRVRDKEDRKAVEIVLHEFFELQADGWHQKRCDVELAQYHDKQDKARRSAKVRWEGHRGSAERSAPAPAEPMPTTSEGDANASPDAMRTHCEGYATRARPISHKPITKKNTGANAPTPDGVSDAVWTDFLKIRKAKQAPMTETALNRIKAQAKLAGMTLGDALETCCARGWQGFEASWLQAGSMIPGRGRSEQPSPGEDRDSKAAVEAEARAKGLPAWNGMEQWPVYLARVRAHVVAEAA